MDKTEMGKLELTFKQTGKEAGDCTTPYEVSLSRDCTLREFVEAVLERKEWGYIGLWFPGEIFGYPKCEYRDSKVFNSEFSEDDFAQTIDKVSAAGGWSRMDYLITLKN